jgi:hypothetical protein
MTMIKGPYRLNENAEAQACLVLDNLSKLAEYGELHESCKLTIARTIFQTTYGQTVLKRLTRATGLILTIHDPSLIPTPTEAKP